MSTLRVLCATLAAALLFVASARSGEPRLENFQYPFPVQLYSFATQQQTLEMAYMDVAPKSAERGTVVLLHGKNFSGAYWEETAKALSETGYRIIIPDQIGFGKSSKPAY